MKWNQFADIEGDEFVEGDWKAIDDVSGFKVNASETTKTWEGYRTKRPLLRNPQDFLRAHKERIRTPWARPEPDDVFGQTSAEDL